MAFIDEIQFHAKAGRGGDGVIRWRQEKFIPRGGPAGGNGGRGGSFYIRAIRDVHVLTQYRSDKNFRAADGEAGDSKSKQGGDGDDFYLVLPVGSLVTNMLSGEKFELLHDGQEEKLLAGGKGGWGNEHFKSSINTTPKKATLGTDGEEADFHVEIQLVADIGLVGLPNAGKSSLLNALTNAKAKIGAYPFTTLDPNLGDFYGFTIADIPGLIEGASEGKGLGTKFLRHVKRTGILMHLVSFENGDAMLDTYKGIRNELASYGDGLDKKEEVIVLTKTDLIDAKTIETQVKKFEKLGKPVYTLTLYDDTSVKKLADSIAHMLQSKETEIESTLKTDA